LQLLEKKGHVKPVKLYAFSEPFFNLQGRRGEVNRVKRERERERVKASAKTSTVVVYVWPWVTVVMVTWTAGGGLESTPTALSWGRGLCLRGEGKHVGWWATQDEAFVRRPGVEQVSAWAFLGVFGDDFSGNPGKMAPRVLSLTAPAAAYILE